MNSYGQTVVQVNPTTQYRTNPVTGFQATYLLINGSWVPQGAPPPGGTALPWYSAENGYVWTQASARANIAAINALSVQANKNGTQAQAMLELGAPGGPSDPEDDPDSFYYTVDDWGSEDENSA